MLLAFLHCIFVVSTTALTDSIAAVDSPSLKSPSPIFLHPSPSDAPLNSPHPSSPLDPPQSSPSTDDTPPVPSPALSNPSDVNHIDLKADGDGAKNSSGGMSSAKKAGMVLGVIVRVGVVGLAGFVYKKHQDNIC